MDIPLPISAESLQVIYEVLGPALYPLLTEEAAWEIINHTSQAELKERCRDELYNRLPQTAYQSASSLLDSLDEDDLSLELHEILSEQLAALIADQPEYLDALAETLEALPYCALENMLIHAYQIYTTERVEGPVVDLTRIPICETQDVNELYEFYPN